MQAPLSDFIHLNQFSTSRRLFAFYRVLEIAQKLQATVIENIVKNAIAADEETHKLEQRWAQKRRTGKPSAKQIKEQKELQSLDTRVDKAVSGLRDAAEATIRGAEDDEKELVQDVEYFLNEILPSGVQAVTSKPYAEQSIAVKAIVGRLEGDLAPLVQKLGLSLNAQRLSKLSAQYDEALKAIDTLEFGHVKAARDAGQEYLLRVTAKILGSFDEPSGEHAAKRLALMAPIIQQNTAISDHIRARRAVPDVDPRTGEEDLPGAPPVVEADPTAAPNEDGNTK